MSATGATPPTPAPNSSPIDRASALELHRVYREHVVHEYQIIQGFLTHCLTVNGAALAAVGTLLQVSLGRQQREPLNEPIGWENLHALVGVIDPMSTAVLAWLGLLGLGLNAMWFAPKLIYPAWAVERLRQRWRELTRSPNFDGTDLPFLQHGKDLGLKDMTKATLIGLIIPAAFMTTWLAVLLALILITPDPFCYWIVGGLGVLLILIGAQYWRATKS